MMYIFASRVGKHTYHWIRHLLGHPIKTVFTNNYVITLMKNLIKVSRLDVIMFLNFTQQAPDASAVPAVLFPRVVWPVKVTFTHESAKDRICSTLVETVVK